MDRIELMSTRLRQKHRAKEDIAQFYLSSYKVCTFYVFFFFIDGVTIIAFWIAGFLLENQEWFEPVLHQMQVFSAAVVNLAQ